MTVFLCLSVCLFVCLFVREHISGTTLSIFTIFLCILPISVARSSFGGVAICYILPVFTDAVMSVHNAQE